MQQGPNFIKVNDISKHLNCSICFEIFKDPIRAPCGHTFCNECLKSQNLCPLCRQKFKISQLRKDLLADKIINDLEVFCFNKKNCAWKGTLQSLKNHIKNCIFSQKDVPDWFKKIQEQQQDEIQVQDQNLIHNEDFQQQLNEHMPQGNLLTRLFNQKKSLIQQNLENELKEKEEQFCDDDYLRELLTISNSNNDEKFIYHQINNIIVDKQNNIEQIDNQNDQIIDKQINIEQIQNNIIVDNQNNLNQNNQIIDNENIDDNFIKEQNEIFLFYQKQYKQGAAKPKQIKQKKEIIQKTQNLQKNLKKKD